MDNNDKLIPNNTVFLLTYFQILIAYSPYNPHFKLNKKRFDTLKIKLNPLLNMTYGIL